MPINLPPELLARHPDWQQGGGSGNLGSLPGSLPQVTPTPIPQGGAGLPHSTSLGTLPVSSAQGQFPYPAIAPTQGYGSPVVANWQATENALAAEQRAIGADRAVIAAMPQLRAAEGQVLNAQEQDIGANRALLDEQTRANNARLARQQAIMDAKADTQDITNVGRAQRERDVLTYRYQIAGLPTPIEITLPPDHKGPLPAGLVKRLQTMAQILTEQDADVSKREQFAIEAARIHAANTGLNVTAAQIKSGRVRLSLDELEEAARLAGYDVRQANLAVAASKQPPIPGLTFDETTGTWVTPSVATLNAALERERINEIVRSRTQQDAGTYGSIAVDTLVSAYVIDGISEMELRQGLAENDMPPATVEVYVRIANARKANANAESAKDKALAAAWEQFFGSQGGSGTGGSAPTSARAGTVSPEYSAYLTSQEREDIR